MSPTHRVVIIGGGFGGLYAAKAFRHLPVDLTVIDRRNYHLFQPLLYQVATGALSPGEIASPIRHILSKQKNTRVLMGEVGGHRSWRKEVVLRSGDRVPYDTLIVADRRYASLLRASGVGAECAGSQDHRRRDRDARQDSAGVRARGDGARSASSARRWLTFVVVGGGATGVELAGALGEIANDTLKHDFRSIDPRETRIFLVEGEDRVLPPFPPDLSRHAEKSLVRLNVQVRVKARVTSLDADGVVVSSAGKDETIPAKTVLWAAGVHASPLGQALHDRAGAPLDKAWPGVVEAGSVDSRASGDSGDRRSGELRHQDGKPLPGVAQVAMQMGGYAARLVKARLQGRNIAPFHYFDKGNLAAIGRAAAVAQIGKVHLWGWVAWVIWLFVHIAVFDWLR